MDMNMNMNELKDLLQIYSKLDDTHRSMLLGAAYHISDHQRFEHQLKEEGIEFSSAAEREKEIEKRCYESATEKLNFLNTFGQLTDLEKAQLMILAEEQRNHTLTQNNIELEMRLKQKSLSLKEFLEKIAPSADITEAYQGLDEFKEKIVTGSIF